MKNKTIILVSLFMLSCSSLNLANESHTEAKDFLQQFLHAEFVGDNTFRVENTIYPSNSENFLKDPNKKVDMIYQFQTDPLCIVDHYKIDNIKIIKSKAFAYVSFLKFACTGLKGYGETPLVPNQTKEIEKYKLIYKANRWWIYDPPLPKVSRKTLIEHNNEIIKSMDNWILKEGTEFQKQYYYNLIHTNTLLNEGV